MKKFLQKSSAWLVMLVAWFAVSMSAMAQDATFDFTDGLTGPKTDGDVTATYTMSYEYYGVNIWNSWKLTISCEVAEIEEIQFDNGVGSIKADCGNYSTSSCKWTGSSNSVTFTVAYSGVDTYIKTASVKLAAAGPDEPITYSVNFIGDVPADCSATLRGQNFIENGTKDVQEYLKLGDLTTTTTADYYADVDYNEGSHTYTVEFKHYYYYNFVIEGSDEGYIRELGEWRSYYDGGSLKVKTALPENDFEAVDVNGYDKSDLSFEAVDAYTTNVKVTYTEKAAQTYRVTFPEDAPAGVSVKVYVDYYNPLTFTESGTFQTNLDLNGNYFDVTTPATHWCESVYNCYNAENHTFTVKLHEYLQYTVAVEGTEDAAAGVVYSGTTYYVGDVIYTSYELTESNVSAAKVDGLEGSVSLTDKTFTVTYTKPSYIVIETQNNSWSNNAGINIVQDGVTVTGTAYSKCLNMYQNQPTTISSTVGAIEKIEIVAGSTITSLNCTSGSFDKDTQTWTAADNQTNEVTLTVNGWDDWYVTKFKVYVIEPEPVEAPAFPVEGVAYEIKNIARNTYLNLQASESYAAYLSAEKEALYFTWDEMKAAFTIKDTEGNYMGKSSNGWNMNSTTPDYWTVEEISTGQYAFKSKSSNYLGFDSGVNGFRDKDYSTKDGLFTIEVYTEPAAGVFTMTSAGWATFCTSKAWAVPEGYTAYTVGKDVNGEAVLEENGEIVLVEIENVPAYAAVILQGPAADGVEVFAPAETPATVQVNFLSGNAFDNEMTFTVENWLAYSTPGAGYAAYGDGAQLYQLAKENDKVGFYRQTEDGSTLSCGAHKAFLVVPAAEAASNARLLFPGQGEPTGIDTVLSTEAAEAIYNLQGQRVNAAKGGVYVKNGKKIIVK